MTTIWVHVRLRLVDPLHKKPDRTRTLLFAPHIILGDLLEKAKGIEKLVREGYVIEDWVVSSG